VLADAGYVSEETFARAGTGTLRLLAPLAKDPAWPGGRQPDRARQLDQYPATARATRRLRHPRGREDYKLRARTVEPVFWQLSGCRWSRPPSSPGRWPLSSAAAASRPPGACSRPACTSSCCPHPPSICPSPPATQPGPGHRLLAGTARHPVPQTAARAGAGLAALRASAVPYLFIAGHELEPEYEEWLADRLPQVSTAVWPGGGHFPHLAHPRRFARRPAATGRGGGQAVSAA